MWALTLGFVAWAAWLWPDVPARLPIHFGASGEPDAWAARSVVSWFALPAVGLATSLLLDLVTRWALRRPELPAVNLPNKAAILALPPERRATVLARVGSLIYTIGAFCVIAFLLIQFGIWSEAHGRTDTGWVLTGVLIAVIGPLAALPVGLIRVDAEVKRQRDAA